MSEDCPGTRRTMRVTAAVIERDGLILIARRPPGRHLAGMWEFPGGKIEPGESPEEALYRELTEELCIHTEIGDLIASAIHDDGRIFIELMAYRVQHLSGEIVMNDHDAFAWVAPHELHAYTLAPADRFLLHYLR